MTASQEKKVGFFALSLTAIELLYRQDASIDELLAFTVLSKGSKGYGAERVSTYGAQSVAKNLSISRPSAEKVISNLLGTCQRIEQETGDLLLRPYEYKDGRTTKKRSPTSYRWLFASPENEKLVYLPHTFIERTDDFNSAIARIRACENVPNDSFDETNKCDIFFVLLNLYANFDLQAFGGVDPVVVGFPVEPTQNSVGDTEFNIPSTKLVVHEVECAGDIKIGEDFWDEIFPEGNSEKIEQAVRILEELGLIYRATVIWSTERRNPAIVDTPLYTLYVHDFHARHNEPYAQIAINKYLLDEGWLAREFEFYGSDGDIVETGRFRYVCRSSEYVVPIGQFRVRMRAPTRDTALGIQEEIGRVKKLLRILP